DNEVGEPLHRQAVSERLLRGARQFDFKPIFPRTHSPHPWCSSTALPRGVSDRALHGPVPFSRWLIVLAEYTDVLRETQDRELSAEVGALYSPLHERGTATPISCL